MPSEDRNRGTNVFRASANTCCSMTLPMKASLTEITAVTSSPRRVSGSPMAATFAILELFYSAFSIERKDYIDSES